MLHQRYSNDYEFARVVKDLGTGRVVFGQAVEALRSWDVHKHAGLEVISEKPSVETGATILLGLRLMPFYLTFACRILYEIEGDDRRGFAYGTLPLHVERGEQSFVVRIDQGSVRFVVSSLSQPAHITARLAAPLSRALQSKARADYVMAMRRVLQERA
jgi:uncharacterized protein (UPF0548 family)